MPRLHLGSSGFRSLVPSSIVMQGCCPPQTNKPPMTEAEANQLAGAEGLTLVLAPGNASGYKGVSRNNGSISPKSGYCAQFCQGGKTVRLGSYSSAPEAALAYARHLGAVTALHEAEGRGPRKGRASASLEGGTRGRRPYGAPRSQVGPEGRLDTRPKRRHMQLEMNKLPWHQMGLPHYPVQSSEFPHYPPPFHQPYSAAPGTRDLVHCQYDPAGYPLPPYRQQWPPGSEHVSQSNKVARSKGLMMPIQQRCGCTASPNPNPNSNPNPNPNPNPTSNPNPNWKDGP